jgi:hypothetical protein
MKNKEERKKLLEDRLRIKQLKKEAKEKQITSKMIRDHPELYVEVTVYNPKTNILYSEYIYSTERKYIRDNFTYELDPIGMNLQPTNKGVIPSYVFIEENKKPYDFTNKNKRIPSRIVKLLYNPDTYKILIQPDRKNLNLILVIIGVVTLIVLGVYAWLNYGHGQIPDFSHIFGGK